MEGKVQGIWKEANITALYNNLGDKCDTTNYRPVRPASLPVIICEKTVGLNYILFVFYMTIIQNNTEYDYNTNGIQ